MALSDLTEVDKAYLAGLIDGEGCISVNKVRNKKLKSGFRIRGIIAISMVDTEAIEYFHKKTGLGSISINPQSGNRRQQRRWDIMGQQAEGLLRVILPYLMIKVKQAQNFLEYREGVKRGHISNQEYERQMQYHKISLELNQRGCERSQGEV